MQRNFALVLLAVVLVSMGVFSVLPKPVDGSASLLPSLGLGLGVSTVCILGTRRLGKSIPTGFKLVLFLLWPIAAPSYVLYSRGILRGLGWTVLLAAQALVSMGKGAVGASFVLWGSPFPPL